MATYIRDIVFEQEPKIGRQPGAPGYVLDEDMVVDIDHLNNHYFCSSSGVAGTAAVSISLHKFLIICLLQFVILNHNLL